MTHEYFHLPKIYQNLIYPLFILLSQRLNNSFIKIIIIEYKNKIVNEALLKSITVLMKVDEIK